MVDLFRRAFVASRLNGVSTISTENGIISGREQAPVFPQHADWSNAAAGEQCNARNDSVAYCDTYDRLIGSVCYRFGHCGAP
jgi:hypothetical protein